MADDDGRPGDRRLDIEAEARELAAVPVALARAAGDGGRMEVLEALPLELQAVVRPGASSPVRERMTAAAVLRETGPWLTAAPRWRAVSLWLLCSATVPGSGEGDAPKDQPLPRGVVDGVSAILGNLDRRGGGWLDPADAPAPEPKACETSADWSGPWPEREWLIGGWLPVGRVGMLTGRGGRGKSRLALQLAARIAADPPAVGAVFPPFNTDPGGSAAVAAAGLAVDPRNAGPVVFASWEDERDEFGRRLAAMFGAGLVDPAKCAGRLHYLDQRGVGPIWAPGAGGSRHVLTAAELTPAGGSLRATCEAVGARLLILDSLAGAYGSDENTRGLVRAFCSSWDEWGSRNRCAVMLIAHPPKANNRAQGAASEGDDFAGSGDWHAASRWRWVLAPADTGCTQPGKDPKKPVPLKAPRLTLAKASYGPDGAGVFVLSDSLGWRGVSRETAARGSTSAGTPVDPFDGAGVAVPEAPKDWGRPHDPGRITEAESGGAGLGGAGTGDRSRGGAGASDDRAVG